MYFGIGAMELIRLGRMKRPVDGGDNYEDDDGDSDCYNDMT